MLDLFVEFSHLSHMGTCSNREPPQGSPDGKKGWNGNLFPALCQFKGEQRTPTEAALLGLVLERRNFAVTRPKLYVVPINELLGAFLSGVIVGTD
jgi:hypothetical protein